MRQRKSRISPALPGLLRLGSVFGRVLGTVFGITLAAEVPADPSSMDAATDPAQSGAMLYQQLCASCHGAEGRGDGDVEHELLLGPRDFRLNAFKFDTDADWQRGTDADLANVIRHGTRAYGGSPQMPSWQNLSEEDIAALVAHVRRLQDY